MKKSIYLNEYETVVNRLREARKEIFFTQVYVSKKLRKPQSYISKIENNERRIDIAELMVLAKLYKKPLDFFIK